MWRVQYIHIFGNFLGTENSCIQWMQQIGFYTFPGDGNKRQLMKFSLKQNRREMSKNMYNLNIIYLLPQCITYFANLQNINFNFSVLLLWDFRFSQQLVWVWHLSGILCCVVSLQLADIWGSSPWWWWQYVPVNCQSTLRLQGTMSQKAVSFSFIVIIWYNHITINLVNVWILLGVSAYRPYTCLCAKIDIIFQKMHFKIVFPLKC
jgi:hypothetical protein